MTISFRHHGLLRSLGLGGAMLVLNACAASPSGIPPDTAGVEWRLVQINGKDVAPQARATLMLGSDGTVSGHGGCNRFSGTYKVESAGVSVGPLMSTKKSCGPELDRLESAYLGALREAQAFHVQDKKLMVDARSVANALQFEPVKP